MVWERKSLDALGEITSSKRIYKKEYVKSGIPFYRTKEIKELANGKKIATELFISQERYSEIEEKFGVPQEGDILLTAIGTIGEVYVVQDSSPFYFKDGNVLWLKNFNDLSPNYLRYALLSFVEELNALSNGAAYNALPINKLKQHQIFVPPKETQQKIVATLDKAFADIDQARQNTEQNLHSARELFDSYLQQVFSERGEDWVEKKLVDAVTSVSTGPFGSMLHKSDYVENGTPIINPINIIDGYVIEDESKTINTQKSRELKSYKLHRNDVVIARRGEIGRCGVIEEHQDGWVCGTGCFYIKPSTQLDPYLLVTMLRSYKYRQALEKVSTGATMKNLSNKNLQNLMLSFPEGVDKQQELMVGIERVEKKLKQLKEIYEKKLIVLDELKQSLLQQAFTGQLTQG